MAKKFHHQEKIIINFSAQQLYEIVKDVNQYPVFLPWCLSAEVIEQHDDYFVADLTVGFSAIQKTFRSHVSYNEKERKVITTGLSDGALSTMNSYWHFKAIKDDQCEIDFSVSLSFSSFLTEKLFAPFFNEAVKKMSAAFLARAQQLAGR